jgi:hypothetical protein
MVFKQPPRPRKHAAIERRKSVAESSSRDIGRVIPEAKEVAYRRADRVLSYMAVRTLHLIHQGERAA